MQILSYLQMPEVSCPRSDCEYKTEVVKPILAAALMTARPCHDSCIRRNLFKHVFSQAAPSGETQVAGQPPTHVLTGKFSVLNGGHSRQQGGWKIGKKLIHQLLSCMDAWGFG